MMQHRIKEHPDFGSKIQNDPIELLKAIKIVMHDPIRAKYPYASLTEALMRTLNIKQLEHKSLIDYMKRFKQSRDVLKSHIGGDILNKFVENLPEYRQGTMVEQCEMKTEAFGRWMAYMMIRNSDHKISTSLVECERVKAKIGKALRADGSPRMWTKFPPARGQKGFLF